MHDKYDGMMQRITQLRRQLRMQLWMDQACSIR